MSHAIHTTRRLTAWLTLVLIILLPTACSKPTESQAPSFEGPLALWTSPELAGHPAPLEEGWVEERARAFESAHKGVTVRVRTFATGEELERALLAGTEPGPDLYLGRPLPGLGDRLATLPLEPALVSDHSEGALAAFRRGETLFGLPMLLDLQVLALNDQAFAARGVPLPANGRWTQSDLSSRVEKLSGDGLFALGFSYAPGYHQWWPLIGGLFTADGAIASGAETGLSRLAEWRRSGHLSPDLATLSTAEVYKRFAAQPARVAIMPIPAWAIPLLRSEPFQAGFSIAAFPGDANAGYVYGLSAFATDDGLKLAAISELATFVAAPDQQVRLARKTGLMPARKSAPNPFDGDVQLTRAFQLAGTFQPLPAGPAWDTAQERIAHEALLALYGGKKPAEALQAARTHLDTATTSVK